MTLRWVPDSYVQSLNRAIYLWHTQGERIVNVSFHPLCYSSCRIHAKRPFSYSESFHIWKHVHIQRSKVWRVCPCRVSFLRHKILLYTSISSFNTSTCLRSTDLRHRMSRLKSTLESVSKAVSGTQAEIFSKIARLRSSSRQENRESEARAETKTIKNQSHGSALAATPTVVPQDQSTTSPQNTSTHLPEPPSTPSPPVREQKEQKNKRSVGPISKVGGAATTTSSLTKSGEPASQTGSSTASKQTTPLFHPSSFSVNLDETYNYLAHHINAYFSSSTKTEKKQKEAKESVDQTSLSIPNQCHKNDDQTPTHVPVNDQTPSPATSAPLPDPGCHSSSKKSIGHYLAYSAPTVQAFVGNYIGPFIPRFRTEPKSALVEAEKTLPPEDSASKQNQPAEIKEQKAAEEKARRLLLQREKVLGTNLFLVFIVCLFTINKFLQYTGSFQ